MKTIFRLAVVGTVLFAGIPRTSAGNSLTFYLGGEPVVRVGLSTNSRSVTVTTSDETLTASSVGEPPQEIASNRAVIEARNYKVPVIEYYRLELRDLADQASAEELAKRVVDATGQRTAAVMESLTNSWRVIIAEPTTSRTEINQLRTTLSEKGFQDSVIVTEKKSEPDADAVMLSQQIRSVDSSKTEIRSLVRSSGSRSRVVNDSGPVDPSIKEMAVSGLSEESKFTSFRPLTFGSVDEKSTPVKIDGKPYRGRVEVFVNTRGTLTVVNVVPIEEYLLGVVPKELGLPSLEAQKAQAVAARTYAIANEDGYGKQGFDVVPTVWSQVYGGVEAETAMGTRAVNETRGMVATYKGKPINALYTSTCGGRTEDAKNVFDFDLPYLKGVECSLEGRKHFDPFFIKSNREISKVTNESDLGLVRFAAFLSVNGFVMQTPRFSDEWLNLPPSEIEMRSWINQIAGKAGKPFPQYSAELLRGQEFAALLASLLYAPNQADTLLSDSDVSYQLAFPDATEIDKRHRAEIALLIRDGLMSLYPDGSFYPLRPMTRRRLLHIVGNLFAKKKWVTTLQTGTTKPSVDGKLVLKGTKSDKSMSIAPNVYLFREFGNQWYQVREMPIIGGEDVSYQTNSAGEVIYLEINPSAASTSAENMSPHTFWTETLSAGEAQSRLARYVKGIGTLQDLKIVSIGYSRRPTELSVVGSSGAATLKRGKIRSALGLKEQLFVVDKKYDASGRVTSYKFTGRGWGHGVGMCQYGAYGLGKKGMKYDQILKHYYTGIDLTKAY